MTTSPRTTPTDVRGVIDTPLSDVEIVSFIDDAHFEVEDRDTGEMSEARLRRIEKYLAAHLIRFTKDRQEDEVDLEAVGVSYSGSFDATGLNATAPGQQVLQLDTHGTFAPISPGGYVSSASPHSGSYDRDDRPALSEREN